MTDADDSADRRGVLERFPSLLDPAWYVSQSGVELGEGESALEHFLGVGRRANLSPGPWLDVDWYFKQYPDVATSGGTAFDHFVVHGAVEGRRPHPDFDVSAYARWKALDVEEPLSVVSHWVGEGGPAGRRWLLEGLGLLDVAWLRRTHGWVGVSDDECVDRVFAAAVPRPGLLFDPVWYVSQSGVELGEGESALEHFLGVGRRANLSPGPWLDVDWYLKQYPDVATAGWTAFDHFVVHGAVEGRRPHPDFDVSAYARWKALDVEEPLSVVSHWVGEGGPAGRRWLLEGLGLLDVAWLRRTHGWVGVSDDECVDRVFAAAVPRPGLLFDPVWYVSQSGVELGEGESALEHFLGVGRRANLSPGPWLDVDWYLKQYPDVATAGWDAFDHYRMYGERWGLCPSSSFVPRLSAGVVPYRRAPLELTKVAWQGVGGRSSDPDWLKAAFHAAKAVEPRLASFPPDALVASLGETFAGSESAQCAVPLLGDLRSVDVLFLLPDLGVGGAIREAANVARVAAAASPPGSVAVITTDGGPLTVRHWFPDTVSCLALQRERSHVLDADEVAVTLANLIAVLRPRTVINVNSRAGWIAYRDYGRALSGMTTLRAMLFCRDFGESGEFGGYADEFLFDSIDVLDLVMFDNRAFVDEMVSDYCALEGDRAKLRVLYHPAPAPSVPPTTERDVGRVLWVGRIAKQKSPRLLAEIASRCPDLTFDVFGKPYDLETARKYGLDRDNINLRGVLSDPSQLSPRDYGAFLLTSEYEGLPNVLLEIGALGLPIVASSVGGVSELIKPGCGWAIPASADAGDYVAALRRALDPEVGEAAARRLQEELAERHSWDRFAEEIGIAGFLS